MNLDRYYTIYKFLDTDEIPEDYTNRQKEQLINQARYFEIRHNLLYKKNRKDPDRPLQVIK